MDLLFSLVIQVCRLDFLLKDLKKIKELTFKLAILFSLDVFTIQPNFITGSIAFKLYSLVISSFLKLLNIVEVFLIYNDEFLELY